MSTIQHMIEDATGRALVYRSADLNRFTIILTLGDGEAFGISRAIRFVLDPQGPGATAHYTDAGRFEHQAGVWLPGDETGAYSLDEIRADPALAAIALVAVDRHRRYERHHPAEHGPKNIRIIH